MKKLITLITLLLFINITYSQTVSFCDDFESYTNGSYLAASSSSWITWTGSPTEDVQITNTFFK